MDSHAVPRKLWEHHDPKSTKMYDFIQGVNKKYGYRMKTFNDLYEFSVKQRSIFWDEAFKSFNLIYAGSYTKIVDENARIDSVPRWFEGVQLNIAENLLYTREQSDPTAHHGEKGKEHEKIAVTEVREGSTEVRNVSWGQLRAEVAELASAMKAHGLKKGDRVAVIASNSLDTLKIFLATTVLGNLFSSSSTDMGVRGILDRVLQVSPKFLFMDDWAVYNGKRFDLRRKMIEVVNGMNGVKEFVGVVSMSRFKIPADITGIPRAQLLRDFLSKATSRTLEFEKTHFRDPFMIAYSSGTTGVPKCIVHSVGGALISAAKDVHLHREIISESVTLQYTSTGWIMYFSSIMNLLSGARIVLYDGSPFQPDMTTFVRFIGDQRVTHFGTSPRWMTEMQRNKVVPKDITDLSNLKIVTSTGMVLSEQLFEWFYDVGFPKAVHLANISGGTDIAGCFGQENPITPVYVGGTQGPSLGIPIAVYGSHVEGGRGVRGVEVSHGTPGELVAYAAFPNMPISFWNDTLPPASDSKYFSAYFEKYDNVWTHGDFVMTHPQTKNLIFLGRADGVLNPSGVRFGSAEIYGVLESRFSDRLVDSICVGQRRPGDEDESVMLFLLMKPGEKFTPGLVKDVKEAIRDGLSTRHVPKYVFETPEIPMTVNLKKVELPVKQIVSGQIIKPSGTLINPESLKYYYQFAKFEELVDLKSKL